MSGNSFLCGWYCEAGLESNADQVVQSMLTCFPESLPTEIFKTEKLIIAGHNIDKESYEDCTITIVGNLYWKSEDLRKYADSNGRVATVAYLFRKRQIDFIEQIAGSFTIIIHDKHNDRVLIAIDRMGQQHCFYAQKNQNLVFSSRVDSVVSHPLIDKELSQQGIYDYVYYHAMPSPNSIYTNVNKLINAEILIFQKSGISRHRYWKPHFKEESEHSVDQLSDEMLEIIERSVKRLGGLSNVGAFLSGGLDSSTVSGMLSRTSEQKARTFSIGFDAKGYDEMEYARIASKHFSTEQNEYYVTPEDVVEMVPKIAKFIDEPFGNSSALPAYFCARMAKERGVERLLAGDGGDEIFAGNERYIKQNVFEQYQKIPSLMRSLFIEPVFLHNSFAKYLPLVKKINSYVTQAKIPLPDRLETYNFLHKHAANEIFSAEFLREVDVNQPIEILREAYHGVDNATTLNRMMLLDWKRTLHDNDLVKVNRMCELAGVEVAYPLLDDELVEFSCHIPSSVKLKDGKLRWFYKEAIKDFLPDQIINKSKQGFGLPFGVWTSEHKGLQELAYTALESLKQRNVFKKEFIDQTIKMHQGIHAPYYGELIWILMMFELWIANQ